MYARSREIFHTIRLQLARLSLAPLVVVILTLTAWLLGGEDWLLVAAVVLPLSLIFGYKTSQPPAFQSSGEDALTGLLTKNGLMEGISRNLVSLRATGSTTAVVAIEINNLSRMRSKFGDAAAEQALRVTSDRIGAALRQSDLIARVGDARFVVCLDPIRKLDLEDCLQLANRLQMAVEEPITLKAASLHLCSSVGFCQETRAPGPEAKPLFDAAILALEEALRNEASAIRTYSGDMRQRAARRDRTEAEALSALDQEQIIAWFQPQVSTDTGKITGFEALARWQHPTRGKLAPRDFLPAMERAGQLGRLSERMLELSLEALVNWQKSGIRVETVGVNFSKEDFSDPTLINRIKGALDRHDVKPERLSIEVLENVVAGAPNDIVVRNINGLAKLGCNIDLDDFGTGHASISSIRRLSVHRLKIDRSFVIRADRDPQQRRLVAAIVTMAEQLGLEVLAEGVETAGEHTILSQLGCTHVQGFGVAQPMSFEETIQWMTTYNRKLIPPLDFKRRAS
ncbi:putative bifunctional diguanylate cyclase/phosphodiesterase [Shimia thalassica]|uniref:putative bifunctional diguanylate cyclase/phosphodiesterase n=1 Tax=Shimia thalassica TaxID=1715693 RepID=UPI0027369440|nr:bifunctional diguanylate cyclase/phosphodiesterase [Shimia thalassica]MDP2517182.1 bifunctional diguanylate cyclase/phosphodiesterase [Shimia thalassica]